MQLETREGGVKRGRSTKARTLPSARINKLLQRREETGSWIPAFRNCTTPLMGTQRWSKWQTHPSIAY